MLRFKSRVSNESVNIWLFFTSQWNDTSRLSWIKVDWNGEMIKAYYVLRTLTFRFKIWCWIFVYFFPFQIEIKLASLFFCEEKLNVQNNIDARK